MELYADTSVVRASVEGLVGTFIGISFFGAAAFLGLGQFVSLSKEVIFSSNSRRPLLLFHWAKPKMASFLRSNFGLEFWSQSLSFLEFVASNSRLACLGSDRMRAERVVAALLWFYKHDFRQLSSETNFLPQAAP